MKHEEKLTYKDRPFLLDIHYSEKDNTRGIVLFLHGFKGYKDWGAWDKVAKEFSQNGYHFIKFNFAFNGTTIDNPTEHVDLEAFGHNTFSKELNQTIEVVDWVFHHEDFQNIPIYFIGHSRGGAIAVLAAAQEARISQLATWSSVADFESDMFSAQSELLKNEGVIYIENKRTNQKLPLYRDLIDDYEKNKDALHVPSNAKVIVIPTIVIHGNEDETVPVSHAVSLHNNIPNSEMAIIDDADHCYNTYEPWDKSHLSIEIQHAIEKTLEFFMENER